jgi:hypothetical protein
MTVRWLYMESHDHSKIPLCNSLCGPLIMMPNREKDGQRWVQNMVKDVRLTDATVYPQRNISTPVYIGNLRRETMGENTVPSNQVRHLDGNHMS